MKDTTQFLTYLRTIISTGSVTAAAKRLYISQPYLSRTISEHERRLGYRLLDRDKRPIALTAIGVQYVRTLEQLNNQYNKLMHDLEKMADVSHLRLGINQSMSTIVAPPLLYRYHQVHPESQIAFTEGISSELGDLLLSGRIDAQLRLMPIFSNEITYYPVCELPVYLLVNDSSSLFTPGLREILTLPIKAAQFDQLAYITLDSGSGFMRQLSVFLTNKRFIQGRLLTCGSFKLPLILRIRAWDAHLCRNTVFAASLMRLNVILSRYPWSNCPLRLFLHIAGIPDWRAKYNS